MKLLPFLAGLIAILATGCGIELYPGQPNVRTDNFAKIDYEIVDDLGLWVYETSYDNTYEAAGVSAVITKLYPGYKHGTSSTRQNEHGTVYRHKSDYEGAEIQMISLPNIEQIIIPRGSQVFAAISFEVSNDEIDHNNVIEGSRWAQKMTDLVTSLSNAAAKIKKFRWGLIKAAQMSANGDLNYEVTALQIGDRKFIPSESVSVTTNLSQSYVRVDLNDKLKTEFVQFFDKHFPTGYKGDVGIHLAEKHNAQPLNIKVGINTIHSLKKQGKKVVENASPKLVEKLMQKLDKK